MCDGSCSCSAAGIQPVIYFASCLDVLRTMTAEIIAATHHLQFLGIEDE